VTVAEKLIESGADVESKHDRGGATPLFIASQNGHFEIVRLLIAKGASPDNPRYTIFIGILLMYHPADDITHRVDGTTPLMIARRAKQTSIVEFLSAQTAARA